MKGILLATLFFVLCARMASKAQAQVLPITAGGTGATTAPSALSNLGLPIVSVLDYGAAGNNSSNDTGAVNAALSACESKATPTNTVNNGCTVYFPAGVYLVTGITLPAYVSLKGDGWGTSVIKLAASTNFDVVTVPVNAFNFSISGLTIDGNSGAGGTGNCLSFAQTNTGPTEWNTANKQTASVNVQKWGHIDEVMFSNCSKDGIHIQEFNYMLFFNNFYVYNSGEYGIYTQGTNSEFSNFELEQNLQAGIYVSGANNRFNSGEVIWGGAVNPGLAAVYIPGSRNVITSVQAEDNYSNGFFDGGTDNAFIGCYSDSNGYAVIGETGNPNASSLKAAGFILNGTGGMYVGDKVTSYRGALPDGNFTTEWPYLIGNSNQSHVDISFDSTNKPPPTVAGNLQTVDGLITVPALGVATASSDANSEPLDIRGSYWNGSSAVSNDWQIQNLPQFGSLVFTPPAVGTNPGSPTIVFPQLQTANATSGNFNSVSFQMQSSVWNGSQPVFPGWEFQSAVGSGTNPDSIFRIFPYSSTGNPQLQLLSNTSVSGSLSWGGGTSIGNSNQVPQVNGPAQGHVACILSSGPPVVIGSCSGAVASNGACACN